MHLLEQAAIFLLTAVLLVPLFRRLKLGAVLGYLAAGMLIGPWGLGLVGEVESTMHFAEFGVVLLLFLVGLELDPRRLWLLRRPVFGLGGAQVVATTLALAAQVSTSPTLPVDGETETVDITGAVLAMVTLLEAAVPESVPSSGVTAQVTTSLPTNTPESVLPVPTARPSSVHA